jgi:dTDP-4-dehydrorhamnose 3,5-epimerase
MNDPVIHQVGQMLDGVELYPLSVNRDSRGGFTEVFSEDWGLGIVPTQWSMVSSCRGVLRGLHIHRRHDELFLVVKGRAFVGLRDVRPGSTTRGTSSLMELSADDLTVLTFPPGILHGWYFPEDSVHLQAVSETYGRYKDDDNFGCHWSDPALEIPWPEKPTIVAPRADAFPSLDVLLERLGWES